MKIKYETMKTDYEAIRVKSVLITKEFEAKGFAVNSTENVISSFTVVPGTAEASSAPSSALGWILVSDSAVTAKSRSALISKLASAAITVSAQGSTPA